MNSLIIAPLDANYERSITLSKSFNPKLYRLKSRNPLKSLKDIHRDVDL